VEIKRKNKRYKEEKIQVAHLDCNEEVNRRNSTGSIARK